MKRPGPLGAADARPRIYIWTHGFSPRWSIGHGGQRIPAKTLGDCIEQALAAVEFKPAVIFYEPAP